MGNPHWTPAGWVWLLMTNMHKWDRWYSVLTEPQPYGDTATYKMGADWLADCDLVEDWGCGKGWMRNFVSTKYRGIDGSDSPFADEIVDLETYRSDVAGLFMRHVLEHNYGWRGILENALRSARERICIVLFTPLSDRTREIAFAEDPGVPDISFNLRDLTALMEWHGFRWSVETLASGTQYGIETILKGTK